MDPSDSSSDSSSSSSSSSDSSSDYESDRQEENEYEEQEFDINQFNPEERENVDPLQFPELPAQIVNQENAQRGRRHRQSVESRQQRNSPQRYMNDYQPQFQEFQQRYRNRSLSREMEQGEDRRSPRQDEQHYNRREPSPELHHYDRNTTPPRSRRSSQRNSQPPLRESVPRNDQRPRNERYRRNVSPQRFERAEGHRERRRNRTPTYVGIKSLRVGEFNIGKMTNAEKAYNFRNYCNDIREAFFLLPGMAENQKYVHFTTEMGPKMRELIQALKFKQDDRNLRDWEELAAKLQTHFDRFIDEAKCMDQLMEAKQRPKETSEEWYQRVLVLAERAGKADDTTTIRHCFLKGKKTIMRAIHER